MAEHDNQKNIEMWKIKALLNVLDTARGNETSLISLVIPPDFQVSHIAKILRDEYESASNIKSRVNRQSFLGAITLTQQRLRHYNEVPSNGLVLYSGNIITEDGKENKFIYEIKPFKPINASLYRCDNKFHTEVLNEILESDDKFGFIVMDGNGTLFGTLSFNTIKVLHKFSADLIKTHDIRGQSARPFAHLRMEKRRNYLRKIAELATQFYINPATSQPNVAGLVLAGSADFGAELRQSDMLDPRLQAKILDVVVVSYGGETGFNEAIVLSAQILPNVRFLQEKKLIGKYLEGIGKGTDKFVSGVGETLWALALGFLDTLIVWEGLEITRYLLKNTTTNVVFVKYLNKEQESLKEHFLDPDSNADLVVEEKMPLLWWLSSNYRRLGCTVEFVTNKSLEGSQFCKGLGGLGGILRDDQKTALWDFSLELSFRRLPSTLPRCWFISRQSLSILSNALQDDLPATPRSNGR